MFYDALHRQRFLPRTLVIVHGEARTASFSGSSCAVVLSAWAKYLTSYENMGELIKEVYNQKQLHPRIRCVPLAAFEAEYAPKARS